MKNFSAHFFLILFLLDLFSSYLFYDDLCHIVSMIIICLRGTQICSFISIQQKVSLYVIENHKKWSDTKKVETFPFIPQTSLVILFPQYQRAPLHFEYQNDLQVVNVGTSATTGTYFLGIYWDLLKNPYIFWGKSHTILRVRMRERVKAIEERETQCARKS